MVNFLYIFYTFTFYIFFLLIFILILKLIKNDFNNYFSMAFDFKMY